MDEFIAAEEEVSTVAPSICRASCLSVVQGYCYGLMLYFRMHVNKYISFKTLCKSPVK